MSYAPYEHRIQIAEQAIAQLRRVLAQLTEDNKQESAAYLNAREELKAELDLYDLLRAQKA